MMMDVNRRRQQPQCVGWSGSIAPPSVSRSGSFSLPVESPCMRRYSLTMARLSMRSISWGEPHGSGPSISLRPSSMASPMAQRSRIRFERGSPYPSGCWMAARIPRWRASVSSKYRPKLVIQCGAECNRHTDKHIHPISAFADVFGGVGSRGVVWKAVVTEAVAAKEGS